jgi:hypothetical protein
MKMHYYGLFTGAQVSRSHNGLCIIMLDNLRNYAIMYLGSEKYPMYAVKYPSAYFENNEQKLYFTVCRSCDWEAEEGVETPGDCFIDECPKCGSTYIEDVVDYV